jgi:hypothetical protein
MHRSLLLSCGPMRSASLRPKARSPDAPMRNGHTPDACEANTVTPPRRQLEAVPPHLQGSYVFKVREERRTGCATAPSTKRSACWEALAETNEGDVRPLARRHRSDVLHLDLARDHLVPQSGDDRRDERQAILALVRDQHAQMLGLTVTHPAPQRRLNRRPESPNLAARRSRRAGATVEVRPALTLGGQSLPAPTLGRRGA